MKDLLEQTSCIRLPIFAVDGILKDEGLELFSRVDGTIDDSNDGNG